MAFKMSEISKLAKTVKTVDTSPAQEKHVKNAPKVSAGTFEDEAETPIVAPTRSLSGDMLPLPAQIQRFVIYKQNGRLLMKQCADTEAASKTLEKLRSGEIFS